MFGGKKLLPLRRLKVAILKLLLLQTVIMEIAVCRSGRTLEESQDFRGIGRTLEETAVLNGIERYRYQKMTKLPLLAVKAVYCLFSI